MALNNFNNPGFRRNDSQQPYFEGYYFKFINDKKEMFIVIAGISISENEKYSFIQIASNLTEKVDFYKFPFGDFKSAIDDFSFSIENNIFKKDEIILNLHDLKAHLHLRNSLNWDRSPLSPNIMGYLSFIPKVECKHDVITIQSEVTGVVDYKDRKIEFDKSSGYIEKNWGYSFPKKYLWLHANQFVDDQLSLQFAIAKPKWLFFRPQVYIGYLKNGRMTHFGSHRLSFAKVKTEGNEVIIKISKLRYNVNIRVTNETPVDFIGPKNGKLQNKISEYLNSEIKLTVHRKKLFRKKEEIINDISHISTTEMHNELKSR